MANSWPTFWLKPVAQTAGFAPPTQNRLNTLSLPYRCSRRGRPCLGRCLAVILRGVHEQYRVSRRGRPFQGAAAPQSFFVNGTLNVNGT